jgi:hypothetical protein
MATNCINCGCSKISCGCGDSFLTTPPPCPTPADCPTAQPCAEVFDAQCVVYTGANIVCDQDTVIATNTSVADSLTDTVTYFCEAVKNKLRFVKEITTNFDSASIGIAHSEITACGITPTICSETPEEFSDFTLSLWWLDGTTWKLLQPYESSTQYWVATVNDTTGTITITITRPIALTSYRLRAVLIF